MPRVQNELLFNQRLTIGTVRRKLHVAEWDVFSLQWIRRGASGAGACTFNFYVSSAAESALADTDPSSNRAWSPISSFAFAASPVAAGPNTALPLTFRCHGWTAVLVEVVTTADIELDVWAMLRESGL